MLNHLETVQQSDLRYPEARIVGTTAAQDKLLAAQALPRNLSTIDYDLELNQVWVIITVCKVVYVDHSSFDQEEGESVLAEQGIRLAYVRGDVTTNAIVMVVDSEVLVR